MPSTTVPSSYESFLDRLDRLFAAQGAQQLLVADPDISLPGWTQGWDRLFFGGGPGVQTLYAVTLADNKSPETLRAQWDQLAAGIASGGALARGNLDLVVVAVYAGATESSARRRIRALTPTSYIPGLRPATWVVDLHAGRVAGGQWWTRSEAMDLIQRAIDGDGVVRGDDPAQLEELRAAHQRQSDAFYSLMRGRQPVVTYALIAANVAMYGLVQINGGPDNVDTLRRFGALFYSLAQQGQWWRFVTMMFLHAGPEHILFNMMSLFAVGTLAERLYGSWKFLALYVGSGFVASLTSFLWAVSHGQSDGIALGASGAVFGIAGALVTVRFQPSNVIPRQLRRRVTSSMAPMVAISLPLSQLLGAHVDWRAHGGGLIGGMVLSMVLRVTQGHPQVASEPVSPGAPGEEEDQRHHSSVV